MNPAGLVPVSRTVALACALFPALSLGCSSDDGTEEGASEGGSESTDGSTTGTTMGTTMGTSASTDSSGAGSSTGGADGSSEGGSSGSSESGVSGCAMYEDQLECMMAGCVPVVGSEYEMTGDMWCLGMRILIECQEDVGQNCEPTVTVACNAEGAAYSFPNTCLPEGWMICDPPVAMAPACG